MIASVLSVCSVVISALLFVGMGPAIVLLCCEGTRALGIRHWALARGRGPRA